MRYPERELVSVNAAKTYCEPVKSLDASTSSKSIQQQQDDILDIEDVTGKRFLHMRKVHECVFGVLALESEPVDPRL